MQRAHLHLRLTIGELQTSHISIYCSRELHQPFRFHPAIVILRRQLLIQGNPVRLRQLSWPMDACPNFLYGQRRFEPAPSAQAGQIAGGVVGPVFAQNAIGGSFRWPAAFAPRSEIAAIDDGSAQPGSLPGDGEMISAGGLLLQRLNIISLAGFEQNRLPNVAKEIASIRAGPTHRNAG